MQFGRTSSLYTTTSNIAMPGVGCFITGSRFSFTHISSVEVAPHATFKRLLSLVLLLLSCHGLPVSSTVSSTTPVEGCPCPRRCFPRSCHILHSKSSWEPKYFGIFWWVAPWDILHSKSSWEPKYFLIFCFFAWLAAKSSWEQPVQPSWEQPVQPQHP